MAPELLALFAFHTLGVAVFGKFESETAWWRLTLKWIALFGITYWLANSFGHGVALTAILLLMIAGLGFHFWWCAKHKIHPVQATPRKKYFELRGWEWKE
jgi:hypothetical protein